MFFKKKEPVVEEPDLWGRAPLALYEKVGAAPPSSEKSLVRTPTGLLIHDFFVVFEKKKPDVRGHRQLLQSALWTNYGSKLYRIETVESKEAIGEMIQTEFSLAIGKDFFVSDTALDPLFSLYR